MRRALLDPLTAAGAGPAHLAHALRVWLAGERLTERCQRDRLPFPRAAVELLPELDRGLDALARVDAEHPARGGGARLLVRLADGRAVESVRLPRDGLCVSTQVGCAVGCTFCMTGRGGLERQLDAAEILAQVVLARRLAAASAGRVRVRRVVFMGMGEPAHNLPAVIEAAEHLGLHGGVGHKDLVVSTVGDPDVFARLAAARVRPALALSLHTTRAALRRELLPRAPLVEPRELLRAALAYARRTGHPLQLQWTLLAGVNDGDDELGRLVAWLRGEPVVVDFIPLNPVPGGAHRRTAADRVHAMTRRLHRAGITAKVRRSAAADVEGACGQLRARSALAAR